MSYHAEIQAALGGRSTSTQGWARVNCPACQERVGKTDRSQCLAVSMTTGFLKCWRCGLKGKIDVPEDLRVPDAPPAVQRVVEPPEGFMSLSTGPAATALATEAARAYLLKRRLEAPMWRAAGLGCCLSGKHANRVVVPVLARDGSWRGWVARDWTGRATRKYLNAPGMSLGAVGALYNEAVLDAVTDEPVMVVEGPFDALALWPHAVAVLGKPTDAQLEALHASPRAVVFVLDGDAWLEAEMLAMELRFSGKERVGWVRLPPATDPDEVDREWLRDEARRALEVEK